MSCGGGLLPKPIPADKLDYIGNWSSPSIELLITQDGRVEYHSTKDGMNKEISAPIQGFEGNNFIVGILGINTTFVVSAPPQLVDSVWTMTVDGEKLTKVQ